MYASGKVRRLPCVKGHHFTRAVELQGGHLTPSIVMSQNFSVCMSVYQNDRPEDFRVAVESVFYQTIPPDEIILVVDGPIPEILEDEIVSLEREGKLRKVIRLPENKGHAIARQTGLEAASNELIAIMDSDDISFADRFEKQLAIFQKDLAVSVVGGNITEFIDRPESPIGRRVVPQNDNEIKGYMKSRCPMNLVTVMFRKSDVTAVGGYLDWHCEEDYYLWIRLALNKCRFYNIQSTLVNVRVGKDMYRRRGGWRYFKSEAALQRYMLGKKFISFPRFIFNVAGRFSVQVLMPNRIRGIVFQKFFRKS